MAAGAQKPINYSYSDLDEEAEILTVVKIRGPWKKKKSYEKLKKKSHHKKKCVVKESQKNRSLPQKEKTDIQRSAKNGRWSGSCLSGKGLLWFLVLACACGVSLAQDYSPTITVIRSPAQVGDRVDVECDVGRDCSGCRMDWFVNGVIVSLPDTNYGAGFISGTGHLVFTAMVFHRNAEIFCILGVPVAGSTTFQNYMSKSAIIQFRGYITTPVYAPTPASDNSIPATDEDATTFDTSNKTRKPDSESSGSGSYYTNGMEQLDMDVPVNTSNSWTTGRIAAAVSLGVGIPIITSIGVVGVLLVCLYKKRKPKVIRLIRVSEGFRNRKLEKPQPAERDTDLPTAHETSPAPETNNDSTDDNDKFPASEQQTAGTLADLVAKKKAAFALRAGTRCRAVDRHHAHSQTTVHEVKSSYNSYNKPPSAETETDLPTAQKTTPLLPGAPMMSMPTLELGNNSQQIEMSHCHSETSTTIRTFLSSAESSYNAVPIDQYDE